MMIMTGFRSNWQKIKPLVSVTILTLSKCTTTVKCASAPNTQKETSDRGLNFAMNHASTIHMSSKAHVIPFI